MTEEQFEAAMRTVQPDIKAGDLTEKQFEAAMRTSRLQLQYRDYILERYTLDPEDGFSLLKLMNSGDCYQGFKEKMTGNQNEQR